MEYLIGFFIAVVIALTGVGAGTITAPILILMLHVPGGTAIGTALGYAAIVKLIISPVQIFRRQVNYKVFGFMILGGGPGVLLGSLLFKVVAVNTVALYWVLGTIIVFSSVMQLAKPFLQKTVELKEKRKDRLGVLSLIMFPIGAEVGLSSSGAGALGTLCLLSLTSLSVKDVVGTDVLFGLAVAILGSGIHFLYGAYSAALLMKLVIGGVFGAIVGSVLSPLIPNKQLRFALACWLLFIGGDFCFRAAKM
jgi:uncharacterized membrane protein YfcA